MDDLHAFLAEVKGLENDLFAYVRLTLEQGRCVDGWHGNPQVRAILGPVRRFGREVHRCQGLLRAGDARAARLALEAAASR